MVGQRHTRKDRSDRPYSIKSAAGAVPIARKRSINLRIKKINDSSGMLVEKRFPRGRGLRKTARALTGAPHRSEGFWKTTRSLLSVFLRKKAG